MNEKGSEFVLSVGTVIEGKYVILEPIGKGGMGEVYRAHQINLKRDVAIKIISHEFLNSFGDDYERNMVLERFRHEVKVMAQIRHPFVLQIYDHGTTVIERNGREIEVEYIVMEYIPGGASLRTTMSEEGFLGENELMKDWIRKYFIPLLEGIEALHDQGIIHRDIKPENILLDRGKPKIADFGLARSHTLKPITQSVDMRGTPPYMPPEQFMDMKRVDQRADVYALGKILYEAVVGKLSSDMIPFKQVSIVNPPNPFFEELNEIIKRTTAEDKEHRIATVEELRMLLAKVIEKEEKKDDLKSDDEPRPTKNFTIKHVLFIAFVVVSFFVIGMMVMHFKMSSNRIPVITQETGEHGQSERKNADNGSIESPDFDLLRFVKGGYLLYPDSFERNGFKEVKVEDFYLNEAPVTIQQYVNFLNSVISKIKVKNNVVFGDGKIWLLLGEVVKGYEPIVYKNGKFYVKNALHTSCPVLRVTAYGASAYVKHYGLRLPTEQEWLYVAQQQLMDALNLTSRGKERLKTLLKTYLNANVGRLDVFTSIFYGERSLPLNTPILSFEPNRFGIRNLNKNIGEWVTRYSEAHHFEYVVIGWAAGESVEVPELSHGVKRQPWEAFEEVGFRCAKSVIPKEKEANREKKH